MNQLALIYIPLFPKLRAQCSWNIGPHVLCDSNALVISNKARMQLPINVAFSCLMRLLFWEFSWVKLSFLRNIFCLLYLLSIIPIGGETSTRMVLTTQGLLVPLKMLWSEAFYIVGNLGTLLQAFSVSLKQIPPRVRNQHTVHWQHGTIEWSAFCIFSYAELFGLIQDMLLTSKP